MFTIHKRDTAGRQPWEYVSATAGTYQAGEAVIINNGRIQQIEGSYANRPAYICMKSGTVSEGGILPVIRVREDAVYKTKIVDGNETYVGAKKAINGEGMYAEEDGSFEVTAIGESGEVYGRFSSHELYV